MKNRNSFSRMKYLLIVSLFSTVFYSGNVFSSETINLSWGVDSLNINGDVINYLELDVTYGKRFFQVVGVVGYTDELTHLIHGGGYLIADEYYIHTTIGLDLIQLILDSDGNGVMLYYTRENDKVVLVEGKSVALLRINN